MLFKIFKRDILPVLNSIYYHVLYIYKLFLFSFKTQVKVQLSHDMWLPSLCIKLYGI